MSQSNDKLCFCAGSWSRSIDISWRADALVCPQVIYPEAVVHSETWIQDMFLQVLGPSQGGGPHASSTIGSYTSARSDVFA